MASTYWLEQLFLKPLTEIGISDIPRTALELWTSLINSDFEPCADIPFVDRSTRRSVEQCLKIEIKPHPGEEGMSRSTRSSRFSEQIRSFHQAMSAGEDVEHILAFRSKADRGLRLIRFPDLFAYLTADVVDVFIEYDYIWALNIALLSIRDRRSYDRALAAGLFDYGLQTFLTHAGQISTRLKFSNMIEHPTDYIGMIELENLTGYRNLPDPSFDYFRDVKGLADSGHDVTNFAWKKTVLRGLFPVRQVVVPTFREWVEGLSWLTAGSSSIGKVEVIVDGEEVKFKARKNCLPFILTLDDIIKVVEETQQCTNSAILKQELKKVRIAVASDIGNYLIQAYLLEIIGDSYKMWTGNTLAETAAEERARLRDMMNGASGCYGLPFDYAAFDHQPSREEIAAILNEIFSGVVLTNEQSVLFKKMMSNLSNEYLIGNFDGVKQKYRIKGGLMSGYRITSLIGNCWNAWMTACASELTEKLFDFRPRMRYLRGDDSALYFKSWWQSVLFRSMYAVVQADGNDKKFGVIWEKMEFLRTLITPEACYGYPNRAAAGITQRKPWSGERWQPINVVSGLADAVDRTARRQWTDLTWLKEHLLRRYSLKSGISYALFFCPQQRGGAGLMPWTHVSCGGPWKSKLTPVIKSDWYKQHLLKQAPLLGDSVDELVVAHATQLVTADDVPGVSRILRAAATKDMRRRKLAPLPKYTQAYWPNPVGPPPKLMLSREEQLMIEAKLYTWGDRVRQRPDSWHWLKRLEGRGCPRWLARCFLEGDAPGTLNVDPKFRGQLSARVLARVSELYSKTHEGWLSLYSHLLVAECALITSDAEYHMYGHM